MSAPTYGFHCRHDGATTHTLVRTEGLGGWHPVAVYTCDTCGQQSRVRMLHEAEDCGFAPEDTLAEDEA